MNHEYKHVAESLVRFLKMIRRYDTLESTIDEGNAVCEVMPCQEYEGMSCENCVLMGYDRIDKTLELINHLEPQIELISIINK